MHAAIFWGFVVLLPTIVEAAIAIVDRDGHLPLIGDTTWFAWIVDLFAVGVLAGVVVAVWIRKVQRPDRFRGSHLEEADRILLMITAIVVSLLLWQATRVALGLTDVARPGLRLARGSSPTASARRRSSGPSARSSGCTCCSCWPSSSTCRARSTCTS